jgi:hypothetical protein
VSEISEELIAKAAQALRDSNSSPEALKWWKKHPQLVPAHVYARAVIEAVSADLRVEALTEAHDAVERAVRLFEKDRATAYREGRVDGAVVALRFIENLLYDRG